MNITMWDMQELQKKQADYFNEYLDILQSWKITKTEKLSDDQIEKLKSINTHVELITMGMQYYMLLEKTRQTPENIVVPQSNLKIVK